MTSAKPIFTMYPWRPLKGVETGEPMATVIPLPKSPVMNFRDPAEAFCAAIRSGRLSRDPLAPNYADNWMYMGTARAGYGAPEKDLFKSIVTRRYLPERNEPGYFVVLAEEASANPPRP